jgi:dipeptidyl aminopeptidase/acylaminoacyl peptidase
MKPTRTVAATLAATVLVSIPVFFTLFNPNRAQAVALDYTTVTNLSGTSAVVRTRTLDGDTYAVCDIRTFTCSPAASTTPPTAAFPAGADIFKSPDGAKAIVSQTYSYGGTSVTVNSLYRVQGTETTFATILPLSSAVSRVVWSSNSVLIFHEGGASIYREAAGTVTPVASAPGGSWLTVSPGGSYAASYVPATASRAKRTFRLTNLATGKQTEYDSKVAYWDLLTEKSALFGFTPDDKNLIYLNDKDGYPTLYRARIGTAAPFPGERLITKPYSVMDFVVYDSRTVFFMANREKALEWNIYKYDLLTGSLAKVAANVSYGESMRIVDGKLLFLEMTSGGSRSAFFNIKTNALERFAIAEPATNATPVSISLPGIKGAFLPPPSDAGAGAKPLIVWLHGGPYRQAAAGMHPYLSYGVYDAVLEEARLAGAYVLKLDYPGSFGYGRSYAESVKGSVGTADVANVLQAVAAAKRAAPIGNVYLMGNSYGGYLALRTIVEASQTFSGAISVNGVTDWQVLLESLQESIFNVHFGGLLSDATSLSYAQASIEDKVGRLGNQKILLVHGENDDTIPPNQGALMLSALKESGKNAELVTYPGETHILRKRSSVADLCSRLISIAGIDKEGACALR